MMQGQTALAWSEDPVTAAKVAVDYANKNKKLEILGGAYGETVLDPQGVESLAKTPDLEESRAKIVGLLQTPAQKVAAVLQAPGSQIARVLQAYADKDQGGGDA
jgi:large subunit ribosomal protein L10